MKMKKRVECLIMASVMAMGVTTGFEECVSADSGTTLTIYGNGTDLSQPYMQKIFEMYEEATGNKIDVQGLDENNYESIALTKFQTGDIPDLFLHNGGYSLDAYNPAENFVDFTDAEWVKDIEDTIVSQTMRGDVVYGLPFWECSLAGMIYNKTIFEEVGIDVPTNQAEFDEVCQKLLDAGIQPIYIAVKDTWPVFYRFAMDPIFTDEDKLKKLNSNQLTYSDIPEMADMLNWYKNSAEKGYFGNTYSTDTWDYSSEVLGYGEAAMMLGWDTWLYSDYDSESFDYTKDDFGIMPAFMGTTDEGTFEGANVNLFLANKNGEHVEEAIDFINFAADPENYNIAFDGIVTSPCLKGQNTIATTVQYEDVRELADKIARPSVTNMEIIGYSDIDGGKCIQELLSGNVNVEECLKLMDDARIKIAQSQQVEGF